MIKVFFLFANLLSKIAFGLTLIFIARQITPDMFGQFSTYISITNFLLSVLTLGLIEYFLISFFNDLKAATSNLIIWFTLLSAFLIGTSYLFADNLFFHVILWALTTKTLVQLLVSIWQVNEKYKYATFLYLYSTITLLIVLTSFYYLDLSLLNFLQWNIILNIPIIALITLFIKQHVFAFNMFSVEFLSNSFRFSFSLSLAYIYMSSDVIMLNYLSSSFDAGIYSAATAILFVTYLIMDILYRYFLPYYSKNISQNRAYYYVNDFLRLVIAVIIPVFLLVLFFHHEIINIAYNADYVEATKYMVPLSFILFIHTFCFPLGLVISARGYQKEKNRIQMRIAILNITANFLLIPIFHIYGAIGATLISEIGLLYSYYVLAQKIEKNMFIDWLSFLKSTLVYVLAFGSVFLLIDNKIVAISIMLTLAIIFTSMAIYYSSIMTTIKKKYV